MLDSGAHRLGMDLRAPGEFRRWPCSPLASQAIQPLVEIRHINVWVERRSRFSTIPRSGRQIAAPAAPLSSPRIRRARLAPAPHLRGGSDIPAPRAGSGLQSRV